MTAFACLRRSWAWRRRHHCPNPGVRTFKFAAAENAYVLVTIRQVRLMHCGVRHEVFVPGREKVEANTEIDELSAISEVWARLAFEHALDDLVDLLNESLSESRPVQVELADA